jgi:hypothetical protein
VFDQRQTNIQQKIDKSQLVLKPHSVIPDDWSVKKGIELQISYDKTAELTSAFE